MNNHSKDQHRKQNTPIVDAVRRHADGPRVSFHVPGHKGNADSAAAELFGERAARCDVTELPGLDDLHRPDGPIRDAENRAARLFGAEETFFLVNGTTSGIMAAIAACSTEKNTVILERNAHLSTSRGLVLSGATPYYIYNYFDKENSIPADIPAAAVREALENCEAPAAVVLTHPSYYGTYSDLKRIVERAHAHGVPVIADEAHGAQLAFTGQSGIPPAIEAGADISVQSTHKMIGSLTQSSMLHVQGGLVNRDKLRFFVSLMNSTSPSYPLMMSLDAARARMEASGREIWKRVRGLVDDAKKEMNGIRGLQYVSAFTGSDGKKHATEDTRLIFSMWDADLSGPRLGRELAERYGIDVEFTDMRNAAALAGAGSAAEDFERLIRALRALGRPPEVREIQERERLQLRSYERSFAFRPTGVLPPRTAAQAPWVSLHGADADGRVSATDISLYPPGVPVIRAGETLTGEIIGYIEQSAALGMEFHGLAPADGAGGIRFRCVEDERDLRMMTGFF